MDRKPELVGQTTQTPSSDEAIEGLYRASYQQVHGIVDTVDVPEGDVLAPRPTVPANAIFEITIDKKTAGRLEHTQSLTEINSAMARRISIYRNQRKHQQAPVLKAA